MQPKTRLDKITTLPNGDGHHLDSDTAFLYHVEDPNYKQPDITTTTGGTGEMHIPSTKKRTRKPWVYQSEYDALKLECDKWKKACKGTAIFAIAYILMDILYGLLS